MDLIKWRKSYETGIGSMDLQHQKLIELINKLYKVIRKEESSKSINEVLYEMEKYAQNHLQKEELLLKTNNYPDLDNHIACHNRYLNRIKTFKDEMEKGDDLIVKETYAFLREWWMEHIIGEDKKYGEFLNLKGVL